MAVSGKPLAGRHGTRPRRKATPADVRCLRAMLATCQPADAEEDVPGYTIKRDGRWKSDAVDAYIRPADQWRNHSFSCIR